MQEKCLKWHQLKTYNQCWQKTYQSRTGLHNLKSLRYFDNESCHSSPDGLSSWLYSLLSALLAEVLDASRFNIKMPSYQYRKSHCGDKTVVR